MTMYFWCESGEDGTSIRPMTADRLQSELDERIKDGYAKPVFLSSVPQNDKGSWMNAPDHAVLVIKGEIIVPKAVKIVEKYQV